MKARLTGKKAEPHKKEEEIDIFKEFLLAGLIDEETEMHFYPAQSRNVINHEGKDENKK